MNKEETPKRPGTEAQKLSSRPVILMVEDDDICILFVVTVLKKAGFDVITATNGKSAVDIFKTHPEITVVLMDIKLPVMGGEEAARQIKAISPGTPIIAETAYAMLGDEARFRDAGFDGYLPKPFDKETLLRTLEKFVTI
ncbi:MAG: response regulator [Bacteroidales bacterium]|nr:response regulator [Bacteroidales bacterium]MDZ4203823.1 response regulator [Bacteroidales bacterium]